MAQLLNSSAVDIDGALPPLLKEYETVIRELENQIKFYKSEHDNLRLSLTSVINENKSLSTQLKESLNEKCNRESVLSPRHRKESDMVANLQRQLNLTIQEKESAVEMWQSTLREVDSLEEELKMYQDNRHVDLAHKQLDEVKHEYSVAINMLEEKLAEVKAQAIKEKSRREELEQEVMQLTKEKQALMSSIGERNEQLEQALKDHSTALEKIQEYEKQETSLTEEIKELTESRNELEGALEKCHQRIEELAKREAAAVDKVKESLSIVDGVLLEKDIAIFNESRTAAENERLNKVIAELIEDAGVKVKEEVDVVKKQYNGQLQTLLNDMKNLQVEVATKAVQLEKKTQDSKVLEEELERVSVENRNKELPNTTLLEKKLESVYSELCRLEKNNFELENERDSLQNKIKKLEESHHTELRQKLLEKKKLEGKLSHLNIVLCRSSQEQMNAVIDAEMLSRQVKNLEQELKTLRSENGKGNWQNYELHMKEHQQLIDQLNDVNLKSAEMAKDLQEQLKLQVDIKNKWQNEVRSLTQKFEERIESLRAQLTKLKRTNRELVRELSAAHSELEHHHKQCKFV